MTPNQQAQKERARAEAEHYQMHGNVDGMKEPKLAHEEQVVHRNYKYEEY